MRRIFIVGTPRSGTTLLQSLLSCSSHALCFKESHVFSRIFSNRFNSLFPVIRSPQEIATRFLLENDYDRNFAKKLPGGLSWPIRALRPNPIGEGLHLMFDALANSQGKSVWIEKTPRHLHFVDLIERSAPSRAVSFVHIVREGVGACASLINASTTWPRQFSTQSAVARWKRDLSITLSYAGRPKHYLVSYDDIAKDPYQTSMKLAEMVGLPLSQSDFLRREEVMRKITAQFETWKQEPEGGQILKRDRSATHVSDSELAILRSTVSGELYRDVLLAYGEKYASAS